MTQQELARRLRRHQSFIAKYEGGERKLEVLEFVQICRELDLPITKALKGLG